MQLYSLVKADFRYCQLGGVRIWEESGQTLVDFLGERLVGWLDLIRHQLSHFAVDSICTNKDVAVVVVAIFGGEYNSLCVFLISNDRSSSMQLRFIFHVAMQDFQGPTSFHEDNGTFETIVDIKGQSISEQSSRQPTKLWNQMHLRFLNVD